MASIDSIRNSIIDKLLGISDKAYLVALFKLVESGPMNDGTVKLTDEQKCMLQMSEGDIVNGRLITQSKLDKEDLAWLKEL